MIFVLELLVFFSMLGALNFTAPTLLVVVFYSVVRVWLSGALSDLDLWRTGRE